LLKEESFAEFDENLERIPTLVHINIETKGNNV
jgi:hypothetical protein